MLPPARRSSSPSPAPARCRAKQQADSGAAGGQKPLRPGNQPGGGIGEPINTPDPLSKYKWWILGGLALLLATAAAFLLRKPVPAAAGGPAVYEPGTPAAPVYASPSTPAAKNTALLNALKEELFALESEKLSGTLSPAEYSESKTALEIVLKRALKRNA